MKTYNLIHLTFLIRLKQAVVSQQEQVEPFLLVSIVDFFVVYALSINWLFFLQLELVTREKNNLLHRVEHLEVRKNRSEM